MKKTLGIFAVGLTLAFAGFAKADNHSNDWYNRGDGKYNYVPQGQFGNFGDFNIDDNHGKGDKDKDKDHCCPPPPCCHNPGSSVPIPSSAYTGGLGVIALGIGSLVRARRAVKA